MHVTLDLTQPMVYKTFQENLEWVFEELKKGLDFSIFTLDHLIVLNSLIQLSTITNWSKFSETDEILNYQKYYIPGLVNIRLFFNGSEVFKTEEAVFNIDEITIDINNYNNFQFTVYSKSHNCDVADFIQDLESINNG